MCLCNNDKLFLGTILSFNTQNTVPRLLSLNSILLSCLILSFSGLSFLLIFIQKQNLFLFERKRETPTTNPRKEKKKYRLCKNRHCEQRLHFSLRSDCLFDNIVYKIPKGELGLSGLLKTTAILNTSFCFFGLCVLLSLCNIINFVLL